MRKLDHLAQICCDKGGFDSENLLFSRRVTRSMKPSISVPMANQQASQPAVVHIEDDIPSSIPDTIYVNNPTFVKGNDANSGKAEDTQPGIDTGNADLEPSSSQHIDSPNSP